MSGDYYSKYVTDNYECPVFNSNSRRSSEDSQISTDSSQNRTLVRTDSLLSCNESELSIRTGSVAYQCLPPRPAPPLPPPLEREKPPPRRSELRPCILPNEETLLKPFNPTVTSKVCQTPSRRKTVSRTFSLKKIHLQRSESSNSVTKRKQLSIPVDQISRTFSSQGLRDLVASLPPPYPPPPPPKSPLRSLKPPPHLPSSQLAPDIHSLPPLPTTPPQSSHHQSERRSPPPTSKQINLSESEVNAHYQPIETQQGGSHRLVHKGRCSAFMVTISCALSFVCCCFTAFIFWYIIYNPKHVPICVPAQRFDNATINRFLQNVSTNQKGEYCATNGDEIFLLIESLIVSAKPANVARSARTSEARPVAVHKHFLSSPSEKLLSDSAKMSTLRFNRQANNKDPSRQQSDGVETSDEYIRISRSGWYFVYSSMHFTSHSPAGTNDVKILKHLIIRKKTGKIRIEETLTQSYHSCCGDCSNNHHTSYTGGIFLLAKQDMILVNVSSPDVVVPEEENSSYLGLMMVGTTEACQNTPDGVTCSTD